MVKQHFFQLLQENMTASNPQFPQYKCSETAPVPIRQGFSFFFFSCIAFFCLLFCAMLSTFCEPCL